MDAQRRIAELEAAHAAEVARSHRLEQQIGQLLEQLAALTQRVAELTERLGQNSRNSHLPPSSDPPGAAGKGGGQWPKSERSRGGQRGHRGSRRELAAVDKVDDVIDLYPAECENCWTALPEQPDPGAKRHHCSRQRDMGRSTPISVVEMVPFEAGGDNAWRSDTICRDGGVHLLFGRARGRTESRCGTP